LVANPTHFIKANSMQTIYKSIAMLVLLIPASILNSAAEPQTPAESMNETDMQNMHRKKMEGMTKEQMAELMHSTKEQNSMMHDQSNQVLMEKDPAKKEILRRQQLEVMMKLHQQKMQ
jgi:hypothetical protein